MATLRILDRRQNTPEVRPLPSTGVTRLRRYYEPLRHPKRPGLSLAGLRLAVTHRHRWGFPCCVRSPLQTCRHHYPGGTVKGIRLLPGSRRQRPSPYVRWVGSRIIRFEACSVFTRVTACLLAESPSDPLHRRLRQLRYLRHRSDCYWLEQQLPGGSCTH